MTATDERRGRYERGAGVFSDSMEMIRQLVQNAIDADALEIDVDVGWEPGPGGRGLTVVQVEDAGTGMDLADLCTRLLGRKPPSGADDLLRIGEHGVGFAAVFVGRPDLVCVDTSRHGEHWRVLLDTDRTYRILPRDEPRDGTLVRVYRRGDEAAYRELRKEVEAALRRSCRHVEIDVRFAGRAIGEPLDAAGAVRAESRDVVAHLVVAHVDDGSSHLSLYNAGLLLHERTDDPVWRGLAIAASSPRLRPTLGYRGVLDDDGLARVHARLHALVAGPLREHAFAGLAARRDTATSSTSRDAFARAVAWHVRRPDFDPDPWDKVPILRTPAREPGPLTVGRIAGRHAHDDLVLAPGPSPLVDALLAAGHTVVHAPAPDDAIADLLDALARDGVEIVRAHDRFCVAVPLPEPVDPALEAVCECLAVLLRAMGGRAEHIRPAAMPDPDPDPPPCLAADAEGPVLRRVDPRTATATALVLAVDRPAVAAAVAHAERDPWYAAFALAKDLLAPLDSEAQARLLTATLDARAASTRSGRR